MKFSWIAAQVVLTFVAIFWNAVPCEWANVLIGMIWLSLCIDVSLWRPGKLGKCLILLKKPFPRYIFVLRIFAALVLPLLFGLVAGCALYGAVVISLGMSTAAVLLAATMLGVGLPGLAINYVWIFHGLNYEGESKK